MGEAPAEWRTLVGTPDQMADVEVCDVTDAQMEAMETEWPNGYAALSPIYPAPEVRATVWDVVMAQEAA